MDGARRAFKPLLRPAGDVDTEGAVHPRSRRGATGPPDVARRVCHWSSDVRLIADTVWNGLLSTAERTQPCGPRPRLRSALWPR